MSNKRALLVGINKYKNSSFNLRGCINDTESLAVVLTGSYGFSMQDIVILKDAAATKDAILNEIRALFQPLGEGDILVFGYSAHGTQFSKPGNETILEAIVPYETTTTASLISNRDINSIARAAIEGKNLLNKVNFTAIYDCCHAGLMYRTLSLNSQGEIVFDDTIINRVLDLSLLLPEDSDKEIAFNDEFQVFAACHHDQTAADMKARPDLGLDKPRGAFSYVLHNVMKANSDITVGELEERLPDAIANLIKPHIQEPLFAVQEAWKTRPILTI